MTSPCRHADRPMQPPRSVFVVPAALARAAGDARRSGGRSAGRALGRSRLAADRTARHAWRGARACRWACRLPPFAGKKRLSFLMHARRHRRDGAAARAAIRHARRRRAAWRPTLDELDAAGLAACRGGAGLRQPGVAGAHGLDYLTDRSDLDLLLHVRPRYGSSRPGRRSGGDRGRRADAAGRRADPRRRRRRELARIPCRRARDPGQDHRRRRPARARASSFAGRMLS